jgi:hypothetical protein
MLTQNLESRSLLAAVQKQVSLGLGPEAMGQDWVEFTGRFDKYSSRLFEELKALYGS